MVRKKKQGQAAMEFLMTYGWAILAAVIAIGVLAYFGVFNPGNFMPSACTLNAPLGCAEFKVNSSGVNLIVRNGAGDSISVTDVTVTNCGSYTNSTSINDGGTQVIAVPCTLTSGGKFKGDITVTYSKSGSTWDQKTTGTITGKVE